MIFQRPNGRRQSLQPQNTPRPRCRRHSEGVSVEPVASPQSRGWMTEENISRFSLSESSALKTWHCRADPSAIRVAVWLGGQGGCPSGHQHPLHGLCCLPASKLRRRGPEPAGPFCSPLPSSPCSDVMGSLKSVVVGVFMPRKVANATHQGAFFSFFQRASLSAHHWIHRSRWFNRVTGGKGDGSGGAVGIRRDKHKCP